MPSCLLHESQLGAAPFHTAQPLSLSANLTHWLAWLQGEEHILCPMEHLTALKRLDLGDCGLNCLPEELSDLQALEDLDLRRNALTSVMV